MPDPIRTGGITTTHHSAIQQSHRANGRGTPIVNEGDTTHRREGQHHSTRPSITMPPHHAMPPHHPQCPHPAPMPGRVQTREPHHTKEHRDTRHHTPHTRQPTARNMTAVLTDMHWTRWDMGYTTDSAGRQQHTPPPFHSTTHEERRTPSTHHSLTLFMFTQSTNDHDQR